MNFRKSLRLRLIASCSLWVSASLLVTSLLLVWLFRTHIERRFDAALYDHLEELVAAAELGSQGELVLSWTPSDPRFNRPHSGWYWQIQILGADTIVAQSDSVWYGRLPVQVPGAATGSQIQAFIGPAQERLRAQVQAITLPGSEQPFSLTVAGPVTDIERDVRAFTSRLALTLGVLALGLLGAVLLQVRFALGPLRTLQQALAQIRTGAASRLPEAFPLEVQPVVTELNGLLEHNAALLERARTQAGNLGHALKNPLTVIRNEARKLQGKGGEIICDQVANMATYIDRHLSQARMAGTRNVLGARAEVKDIVDDLRFSLDLLYRSRGLKIRTTGLAQLCFQGDAQDLEEMLGNLMDNACKWARSEVLVRGERRGARLTVAVEDDGPGIPEAQRSEALQRGRRLDESVPGSGLGLAIVQDIAELYRGSLRLERSALGGTRAELDLPAVESKERAAAL